MTPIFWKNLNKLREYFALSISEACDEINSNLDLTKNDPDFLSKGRFDYLSRRQHNIDPSSDVKHFVNSYFCFGRGLDENQYNIMNEDLDDNALSYLASNANVQSSLSGKESWALNFWHNYAWIEECYRNINQTVPVWEGIGKYSYRLRATRDKLPPATVLKDFAKKLDVYPYTCLYLAPFSGQVMLNMVIAIQNASFANQDSMLFESLRQKAFDNYTISSACTDVSRYILKIKFLAMNGLVEPSAFEEIQRKLVVLSGKPYLCEITTEETKQYTAVNFYREALRLIQDGGKRLEERWQSLLSQKR